MPGSVEIKDHEPSDEGWGIVLGPFRRPPAEQSEDSSDDSEDES